jgi:hypothetical protein
MSVKRVSRTRSAAVIYACPPDNWTSMPIHDDCHDFLPPTLYFSFWSLLSAYHSVAPIVVISVISLLLPLQIFILFIKYQRFVRLEHAVA